VDVVLQDAAAAVNQDTAASFAGATPRHYPGGSGTTPNYLNDVPAFVNRIMQDVDVVLQDAAAAVSQNTAASFARAAPRNNHRVTTFISVNGRTVFQSDYQYS
jgi:hypothetical protein